jgi:hypothetical protein
MTFPCIFTEILPSLSGANMCLSLVFGFEQGIPIYSAHKCNEIHHEAELQMVPDIDFKARYVLFILSFV